MILLVVSSVSEQFCHAPRTWIPSRGHTTETNRIKDLRFLADEVHQKRRFIPQMLVYPSFWLLACRPPKRSSCRFSSQPQGTATVIKHQFALKFLLTEKKRSPCAQFFCAVFFGSKLIHGAYNAERTLPTLSIENAGK